MTTTITDRLDGVTTSLAVKAPVDAVTNAPITLSGEQTINGVAVTEGDRVLVKDQSDATENGIYDVSTGSWTRSSDFDGNRDVVHGTLVIGPLSGTLGALYQVTTADPIVIGTSSIAFTLQDTTDDPYDVKTFGAVGDGVTDDTTALQLAFDTLASAIVSPGTYLTTGLDTGVAKHIEFRGATLKSVSNARILTIESNDVTLVTPAFLGDGKGASYNDGKTNQDGIYLNDKYRCQIIGPRGKDLGGALLHSISSVDDHTGNSCSNPYAYQCNIGIHAAQEGEYLSVVGGALVEGNWGVLDRGGNLITAGINITSNGINYELTSGPNDGHGIASGCNINHATDYDIKATDITNGFTFDGCHQYQGDIWFKDCTGIIFHGGISDAANYYFDGSDGCGFVNVKMPNAYGNTINNNFDSSPSYTIWRDCKLLNGDAFGENYKGIRVRAALSSPVNIAAATLAAETTVLLEDTANSAANHAVHTLYDGYAAGTGLFTCRGKGDGKVRITATIDITNNAADDSPDDMSAGVPTIYAYLQKNSSGIALLFGPRVRLSSTRSLFSLHGELDGIAENDTLRIRIGSIATLANAIDIAVTGTNVVVEGL